MRRALFVILVLGLLLLLVNRARSAPVISRVPTTAPLVALTFDDGPQNPYTSEILALLMHAHAHATFFVLGQKVAEDPQLLQREFRDGMEIALHGMTHLNLHRVGARLMTQDAVREIAYLHTLVPKASIRAFRPPYGFQSRPLRQELSGAHLELVLWDVDTRDWMRPGTASIVQAVERLTKPGSIVLFHDGGGNRSETVAALRQLLPWFHAHHYRLVTVSTLLAQLAK
jgi:peptidoglycan/xylan/chitin deacetylase (PgdA/CDA1 family)